MICVAVLAVITRGFLIDRSICPDAETCAKACEYEGVDYKSLGVTTEGSALTMRLFLPNETGGYTRVSPRLYLLAEDDMNYEPIRLLNQEMSFDVDMLTLGCGLNGALYLDEMDFSGSRSETDPAGAQYGTGYCDAQCYNKTMINGVPSLNNSGACCHEMDIWEANGLATVLTPHTCSKPGPFLCTGAECGREAPGVCDKAGCGLNPYKTVGPDFYGPGKTVDTKRPFAVVTQFWTDPQTNKLSDIRRIYVQDGRSISAASPEGEAAGGGANNTATAEFCTSNKKEAFDRLGGMEAAGEALDRGMVLIFSIWNDLKTNMNWLDSGEAGPCGPDDGAPEKVLVANPSDNTIVDTATPTITNEFHSLTGIGWYGPAYRVTTCSTQFFYGKLYEQFRVKWIFVTCVVILELGSIVCASAPTSTAFIIGRAIAGCGASGIVTGVFM
ncbi:uncharacterized protein PG986_010626 [Apiospora aurea]|uniref:Glucanase n=1 Tax=Apiospora aurea TaxID=335848 RepID=A0ABR1Q2S0_9PEZI